MKISPLAGKVAPSNLLIDVAALQRAYTEKKPNPEDPSQGVIFGTSGHRGSSLSSTFNEAHILAITQAVCDFRKQNGINGPIFVGMDTHAVSNQAQQTVLEVLAANEMHTVIQSGLGVTPTPVISRTILDWNQGRETRLADGIIITPSHNPPADGGIKYNGTDGGPADTKVTRLIQDQANAYLRANNVGIKRLTYEKARRSSSVHEEDFVIPYVKNLSQVIDLGLIKSAKLRLAVDPLGGASHAYWQPINEIYGLDVTIVNKKVDPTFSFMTVDHDGKIRMDCSSPYAMASLIHLKDQYQLAFGNDTDCDRHGIITPTAGLMNPNHYLAVAIDYLLKSRNAWAKTLAVGKTLVSSSMIDFVVKHHARRLAEMPVGFKWFAPHLFDGSYCFGGEESAGASFLKTNGTVWTTDKDGFILDLLAAEILAATGKDPGIHYQELTQKFGSPLYTRIDKAVSPEMKSNLLKITPDSISTTTLAGDPITSKITNAPANGAAIGGIKVSTKNGWFVVRPSGTENIYKIYAESFKDQSHLDAIISDAEQIVGKLN